MVSIVVSPPPNGKGDPPLFGPPHENVGRSGPCAPPIAVIGQTLVNRRLTTLPGHEQPVRLIPEAEVHRGPSLATWHFNRSPDRQVSRHRCRLPLPAAASCLPRSLSGQCPQGTFLKFY